MAKGEAHEIGLSIVMTDELLTGLAALRSAWHGDPKRVPKGLSCSESANGEFVLTAAESAFTTLPGACVIKGLGAIQLTNDGPIFEDGAHSKTLVLRETAEGWRFIVKFVAPVVRGRNTPRG